MLPWLGRDPRAPFPPPETALREPNGLLAVGGDLNPQRLLTAYRLGIFPWYSEGEPILWWTPDPRWVLTPATLHLGRSLRKSLRHTTVQVSLNQDFSAVVRACAAPRSQQQGTWLNSAMQAAYLRLHLLGYAHAVEIWQASELVGGLYGVALGGVFFGESMFSRQPDASKFALIALVRFMQAQGMSLLDCQVESAHLRYLGASPLPRMQFQQQLTQLCPLPLRPHTWPAQILPLT